MAPRRSPKAKSTSRETEVVSRYRERCKTDIDFLCENELKIVDQRSHLVPFVAKRAQKRLDAIVAGQRARGVPVRVRVLKGRKVGQSTRSLAHLWQDVAFRHYRQGRILAHDDESTVKLFIKCRVFHENMSEAVRPPVRYGTKREFWFERTMSILDVQTAGNPRAGRAETINALLLSEVAHYERAEDTLLAIRSSVPKIADSMIVEESTANGRNHFYDEWNRSERGEDDYALLFIGFQDDEEATLPEDEERAGWFADWMGVRHDRNRESWYARRLEMDDDERDLCKRVDLTWGQVLWRRWVLQNDCNGNIEKFRQEHPAFPEEAFLAAGRCYFDVGSVRKLLVNADEGRGMVLSAEAETVLATENQDAFLRVFDEPTPGGLYVVGADVAQRHGEDESDLVVVDRRTLREVAAGHGHIDLEEFAELLWLVARYYRNGVLGIEVNGPGLYVVNRVRERGYPYQFHRHIYDDDDRVVDSRFGWLTSAKTRPLMLSNLKTGVLRDIYKIRSRYRLDQMLSFEVPRGEGGAKAAKNKRDDGVLSSAIAYQIHRDMGPVEDHRMEADLDLTTMTPLDIDYYQRTGRKPPTADGGQAPHPVLGDQY